MKEPVYSISMIKREVIYFEKPGRENTGDCLDVAAGAAKKFGYSHIVVASTHGDTGLEFSRRFKGLDTSVIVVTHSAGFKEPNSLEMPAEVRAEIESNGATVFTGTILTHSLETALSAKSGGLHPTHVIALSLRRFGEGMKVCCECVMMAVDAGLIPEGDAVLAVAGTARGADTVSLIRSAASKRFLDLKVMEVLAKPRL